MPEREEATNTSTLPHNERAVGLRTQQQTVALTILAAVDRGIGEPRGLQDVAGYVGSTVESFQEALSRLSHDGLIEFDSHYIVGITDLGKEQLARRVELETPIGQMAELAAEYTQKMHELGAKAVGSTRAHA